MKVATSVKPGLLVAPNASYAKPSTATTPKGVPRTSPPTTTSTTEGVSAKATSTSSSAKPIPRVANAKAITGKEAKDKPTLSSITPLPLSTTSALRKLSEPQTSDASPGNSVSERTRTKTNHSEISEDDWNVVKEKMANMKASLKRMSSP